MNTLIQEMIEHHVWANDTLLTFCEGLTADQLALTAPGTAGTVEETFVHVAANEEGYLRELGGVGVGGEMRTTIFNGEVPRELASVRPILARTSDGWRTVVRDWPENAMKDFPWEGKVERMPISDLVVQVINHGTEHRSHIRTILSSNDITPPEIDVWAWQETRNPARMPCCLA